MHLYNWSIVHKMENSGAWKYKPIVTPCLWVGVADPLIVIIVYHDTKCCATLWSVLIPTGLITVGIFFGYVYIKLVMWYMQKHTSDLALSSYIATELICYSVVDKLGVYECVELCTSACRKLFFSPAKIHVTIISLMTCVGLASCILNM